MGNIREEIAEYQMAKYQKKINALTGEADKIMLKLMKFWFNPKKKERGKTKKDIKRLKEIRKELKKLKKEIKNG